MDVLAHVGITCFQREVLRQQGSRAQTGLEAVVGLVVHTESGVVEAGVHLQEAIHIPVVLYVKIGFQSPDFRIVRHAVEGIFRLVVLRLLHVDGCGGRTVGVMGEVGTELNIVVLERLVVEVGLGTIVIDAGVYAQVHAFRVA